LLDDRHGSVRQVSQVGFFFFFTMESIQSNIQLQYLHQFRPWASAKSRYTLGTDACPVPHLRAPHPHPAFRLPTQPPEQQQFIHGTRQNLEAEKNLLSTAAAARHRSSNQPRRQKLSPSLRVGVNWTWKA
jgi:hypothetical protein